MLVGNTGFNNKERGFLLFGMWQATLRRNAAVRVSHRKAMRGVSRSCCSEQRGAQQAFTGPEELPTPEIPYSANSSLQC